MIKKLIENFKIYGDLIETKPFGNGNINETFLLKYNQAGTEVKYILRKINKYVFKNPEIVINNTIQVINHISNKLQKEGEKEISNYVMKLVENKNGSFYQVDKNGDYWTVFLFINNAYTVSYVETKEQAYQAAKAFGKFQRYLIDVNLNEYKETIPNFHNLSGRLSTFDSILEHDPVGRVVKAKKEIEIANNFRYVSEKITEMMKNNKIPIRITHNDTKIDNVMLNKKTNAGQCVIDLDTVMPGIVLNDFGDMVRTSTSPVAEDEKDASKVTMRMNVFEGLAKGYMEELSGCLSEIEIDNLVYGAMVIVYEQLIRFLSDYINGDKYYITKYDEHNLVRTRTQIALLKSIINQKTEMEKIISDLK
jgi:hypothetical protein